MINERIPYSEFRDMYRTRTDLYKVKWHFLIRGYERTRPRGSGPALMLELTRIVKHDWTWTNDIDNFLIFVNEDDYNLVRLLYL